LVFYGLGNFASVGGGVWFTTADKEGSSPVRQPDGEALLRAR
jgi:hypothetical protein